MYDDWYGVMPLDDSEKTPRARINTKIFDRLVLNSGEISAQSIIAADADDRGRERFLVAGYYGKVIFIDLAYVRNSPREYRS